MKTRYVFGHRDVVVTIVGAVFLFGVIYAQDYLASNGFYFFKRYCYLPDVFLAIVSGVFGYVPGVIAGISGRVLAGMLLFENVEYIDVISVALFALIIGINSGRYRVLDGRMDKDSVIDFCLIQTLGSFVTWMFIALAKFLVYNENYFVSIRYCSGYFIGTCIVTMILGSLVMYSISRIIAKRVKTDG